MLPKPSLASSEQAHPTQALARHTARLHQILFFSKPTAYKSNHLILDGQAHDNALQDMHFTCIDGTLFTNHLQRKPIAALSKEEKLHPCLKEPEHLDREALANLVAKTLSWHDCSSNTPGALRS